MMSDVLQERDIQAALKKRKAAHEKNMKEEWEDLDRAKMEAFDEKVK